MKIFLILFIAMSFGEVHAQPCTDIKYRFEFKKGGGWVMNARYTFNDSAAFFYFYKDGDNPLRKAAVFSKKLIHHALFTDKLAGIMYDEVNYPAHNRWLIKDTLNRNVFDWQATGISKTILGTNCEGYLNVTPEGDSTLAYVSSVLGDGKGFHYYGLHGVALEVYDQATGYHIIAGSIQKMDCSFQLPDNAPQISRKEIDEQHKK